MQQIQSSGELVKLAVSDALQTESALGSIAAAVSLIQQMNQQIAAAAEEQSSVAEEINRSVTSIRASADQSSLAMQGNAASSIELAQLGSELRGWWGISSCSSCRRLGLCPDDLLTLAGINPNAKKAT